MIQTANMRLIDLGPEAIASVDPFGAIGTKPTNGKASTKTYPRRKKYASLVDNWEDRFPLHTMPPKSGEMNE